MPLTADDVYEVLREVEDPELGMDVVATDVFKAIDDSFQYLVKNKFAEA